MIFLQPIYLIGLALTAVPIIIHLWFRKKLDKIPFSTLKFLKKSEARRFGWLRIREIIVLILRSLLIALIFFSLAKLQCRSGFLRSGHLASVVVIFDNSFSMAYGDNFMAAKTDVLKLLSRYSAKSDFCILALCRTEDTSNANQVSWVNKKSAIEQIHQINISNKTGTIRTLSPYLVIEKSRYPVEYIYVGDGQETVFADLPEELTFEKKFYWVKIPVGNNVGITDVFLKDPIAISLDNYVLSITVKNYGPDVWSGKINLQAEDFVRERECEIRPANEKILDFTLPVTLNRGTVHLYDDSLLPDNTYYFSKSLPGKIKVLIIGTTRFLGSALNPTDDVDGPFLFDALESISSANLQHYGLVILNGINEISKHDKIKLETFLMEDNKGVVCFLGQAVGDNLNSIIGRCCRVEEYVSVKGYVTLDWIDYDHPIFQVFEHTAVLKNIKFHNFHKLNAPKNVIAKLTGNNPFIVIDNGLCVVATQFLPQNTDIVYKTAFVPLIHRLIVNTMYPSHDHELYVGDQTLQFDKLKAPTGEYLLPGQVLLKPGFYTTTQETLGVNVIAAEGNLKTLGNKAAEIMHIEIIDPEKEFKQNDMSITLLLLALFALLLESLLLLIR